MGKTTLKYEVVYPVFGEVEVDNNLDDLEKRQAIIDHADSMYESSSISPYIKGCSNKKLEM